MPTTTAIRHAAAHHEPAATPASATTLTRSIGQFRGIGHVLKDPLRPRPDLAASRNRRASRPGRPRRRGWPPMTASAIGLVAISENVSVSGSNTVTAARGCRRRPASAAGHTRIASPLPLSPGGVLVDDLEVGGELGFAARSGAEIRSRDPLAGSRSMSSVRVSGSPTRSAVGAGGRRHAVAADPAAKCRGPRSRHVAHLQRHRGGDRDQPPAGVTGFRPCPSRTTLSRPPGRACTSRPSRP